MSFSNILFFWLFSIINFIFSFNSSHRGDRLMQKEVWDRKLATIRECLIGSECVLEVQHLQEKQRRQKARKRKVIWIFVLLSCLSLHSIFIDIPPTILCWCVPRRNIFLTEFGYPYPLGSTIAKPNSRESSKIALHCWLAGLSFSFFLQT